jgi:hypothetical protein
MKTADVLYHWGEPPAFGELAMADALADGVVLNAICMGLSTDAAVLETLSKSRSDAILSVSPAQFGEFHTKNAATIRSFNKPLLSFTSEWCDGNPIRGYDLFDQSENVFDVRFYGQACDADNSVLRGRLSFLSSLWVSTTAFSAGPPVAQRKQKLVFIGDTNEYAKGVYAQRRRMLDALESNGLVDVLVVEKSIDTVAQVRNAYAEYAGVFCASSNGRSQGIRVYEAASSGAVVVEAQPMDVRNEFFKNGIHRIAIDPSLDAEALCQAVSAIDFVAIAEVAERGQALVREMYNPSAVFARMLATADKALKR